MEGSSVEKNSYNENNYYLSYLKYMKNLSRDKFFNSDGKAYCCRQILFRETASDKEALNAYCKAETRCEFYSIETIHTILILKS